MFVCKVSNQPSNGLLLLGPSGERAAVMLLFTNPHAALDYMRATRIAGAVGQIKIEDLPKAAQTWLSSGVKTAILDRCPRCPQSVSFSLEQMAQWKKEDFAKIWAMHRATRLVLGETRIRSAMKHLSAGSYADARTDLEYVRDHFDCGVPYLHQMIGLVAGMQEDATAKDASSERLKEFGPQFAGPLEFSTDLLATAMVGLTTHFGIVPGSARSA